MPNGKRIPNDSPHHLRQHLRPILRKTNRNQNSCLSESVRHGFCLEFAGRDQATLPHKLLQNSAHAQNCLKRPCGPGAWQHGGPSNRPNNGLKPLSCPIYRKSVTAALPSREPRACILRFLSWVFIFCLTFCIQCLNQFPFFIQAWAYARVSNRKAAQHVGSQRLTADCFDMMTE